MTINHALASMTISFVLALAILTELEAYRTARTGVIASAERAIATACRAIAWVDATTYELDRVPVGSPTRR